MATSDWATAPFGRACRVWIQKSIGPWTTYGGAGYEVNHAPGMQSSVFAGWLVQREITKRLTLGAEVYGQGPTSVSGRESTYADAGGYLTIRGNLSFLFMLGHTFAGERHTVGYFGLYYTWGPRSGG